MPENYQYSDQITGSHIVLSLDNSLSGGKEAYQLTIDKHFVSIVGASEAGVFRAVQTLKALLPVKTKNKPAFLSAGLIKDQPRFEHRGFMLKASDIVSKYGKKLVGWTNDLGSVEGLSADVIGQHWTTENHCCESTLTMAERGSSIIMSPANKAYFDLKYDKDTTIGLIFFGFNSSPLAA